MKELLKITMAVLFVLFFINMSAQNKVPLHTSANGAMLWSNAFNHVNGVTGQNAAGIISSKDNKVYVGMLAPLAFNYTGMEWWKFGGFTLGQNYPNPFQSKTTIPFELSGRQFVTFTVYDVMGQPIEVLINEIVDQGKHTIIYNAKGIRSGIYLYRIEVQGRSIVKSMALRN